MDRKGTVMELDEILNAEPEFRYPILLMSFNNMSEG